MIRPDLGDDRVARLVLRALERHGAALEENGGRWSALLPEELARELSVPEYVSLAFDAADRRSEDEVLATLGAPFVEAVLRRLLDPPAIHSQRMDGVYLKKQGLGESVERRFQFPNAKAVVSPGIETHVWYTLVHLQYQAQADVREDGMVAFGLNEATLGAIPDLPDLFARQTPALHEPRGELPRPISDSMLAAIRATGERIVEGRLAGFRRSVQRRCDRDRERVRGYFEDMLKEHEKTARRQGRTDEQRAASADKALATARERDRKLDELDARYSIRVHLRTAAAARLSMPVMTVPVTLRKGKETLSATLYWNPLQKDIEPLPCAACSHSVYSLFAGKGGRLMCKACHESAAKGTGGG